MLGSRTRVLRRGFGGKGEGDVDAAGAGLGILAAACGNHDKLTAVHFIGGGSGVSRERKGGLPKELTGGFVVGAEFFVKIGCADEEQPPGSDDWAAIVL